MRGDREVNSILTRVSVLKKLAQIGTSIAMLFFSSHSFAEELMHIGFDNKTDSPIYYKFTKFAGVSVYGVYD